MPDLGWDRYNADAERAAEIEAMVVDWFVEGASIDLIVLRRLPALEPERTADELTPMVEGALRRALAPAS